MKNKGEIVGQLKGLTSMLYDEMRIEDFNMVRACILTGEITSLLWTLDKEKDVS